jgi:iron-sulfur cluster assembly protein
LALDESKENDEVFDHDGLQFIIEKGLLEELKPIRVDYVVTPSGEGFTVDSKATGSEGCGSCSSC